MLNSPLSPPNFGHENQTQPTLPFSYQPHGLTVKLKANNRKIFILPIKSPIKLTLKKDSFGQAEEKGTQLESTASFSAPTT